MNITATLFGQMIWFAIFIWLTMKYIWPPLQKALADRQKKISDGLAAAEQAKRDQEEMQRRSTEIMQDSRKRAAELLSQAQKQCQLLLDEARQEAHQEHERILTEAKAAVAQEVRRAREHLREQVADLAISAASKILKREVDPKAHSALLDELGRSLH